MQCLVCNIIKPKANKQKIQIRKKAKSFSPKRTAQCTMKTYNLYTIIAKLKMFLHPDFKNTPVMSFSLKLRGIKR